MKSIVTSWQAWALLSAGFAAATAILAKIGVKDIDSNLATFIRTIVVLVFLAAIVAATSGFHSFATITPRSHVFLVLSGLATGASWLCYFRAIKLGPVSQVAPLDKLSLLLVALMGVLFLGEKLSDRNWVGLALMAVGAILVALKR